MKQPYTETIRLDKIVGGGQALGTLADGRKLFAWGGLPGEMVEVMITKKRSKLAEGVVTRVLEASPERLEPADPDSYLSTSPWQIMDFEAEQRYKVALIEEAFELHDIVLPDPIAVYSDEVIYAYRNKVEFSWWWDNETNQLDLAFFRRGTKGKIPVNGTNLARPEINELARRIRDCLRRKRVEARSLKTLMIRCTRDGSCVWQLYVKDKLIDIFTAADIESLQAQGGEVIYSDPKSPASRISERLKTYGDVTLTDTVLDTPFRYACESFFQVNVPVYEQALHDMKQWVEKTPATGGAVGGARKQAFVSTEVFAGRSHGATGPVDSDRRETAAGSFDDGSGHTKVVDMYSGVGTIGLTIGGPGVTLVETDEHAVREMQANIKNLNLQATAVFATSEKSLSCITQDAMLIVDPPRAGLHADVVERILEVAPPRVMYLSCNPVTQARDIALMSSKYGSRYHHGYNFFPRTPHIEHLVVLEKR